MNRINIALLGMGRIGKIHFQNILRHFPQASIRTVADPQLDFSKLSSDYPAIRFTADPVAAVQDPDTDAVLICTPTSTHAELLEKVIETGKNCFCEKPLDLTLAKTKNLAELAAGKGIKLMMGFNRRFDPDFMQAKRSIAEGRIGEVQIVKITSRDPGLPPLDYVRNSGGLFMDMAIHDFDMARYLTGKEVVEVYAKGLVKIDKAVGEAGDVDTALTTLVFEDGSYAVIDNSRKASYGYDQRLEIFGSKGMIQVGNNVHHQNVLYDATGVHHALPLDFFMDRYQQSYLYEMQFFLDAIATGKDVPVGARDAVKATQIAFAAKQSVESGQPIRIEN